MREGLYLMGGGRERAEGGEEGTTELKATITHLKRRLHQKEDTHRIELQESKVGERATQGEFPRVNICTSMSARPYL